MKNIKIKDEYHEEIKVYLLALNQLDCRKVLEKDDPDKYKNHYLPIEKFIVRKLKTWGHEMQR